MKNKLQAFTMAEVLITLGIIGVVAAMTLPTLVNKAEKYILKQQFKKTYNVLQNVLMKVYEEYGTNYDCYYEVKTDGSTGQVAAQQCTLFFNHFEKVLKVNSVCVDKAYQRGCIPKYKGYDTVSKEQNPDVSDDYLKRQCPGYFENAILNKTRAFVLSDGTIIVRYHGNMPLFMVDINGNKSPNKWGYDVFSFNLQMQNNQLRLMPDSCFRVEKGGVRTDVMLKELYK